MDLLFQAQAVRLAEIDRGLFKTLIYGVLRHKHYLDHIIRRFAKHPLGKMKPRTLMTLRIGVFQLLFLHRMPASAAVNATVNTLKDSGQPAWLIGFANGLLRAVARERANLPTPEALEQAEPPLLNHPAWLVERWQSRFGQERARSICRINNTEPALTLRVNNRATSRSRLRELLGHSGIVATPGLFSPNALIIDRFPGAIEALPGYADGHFLVQDEAAQLVPPLLAPLPDRARVLDACAGLGGKTSHLAELLPPQGSLVAIEPDGRRFGLLRQNLARLGLTDQVRCLRTDLARFADTRPHPFDAILVDAPCSGTGVIRRQPDIRWNRQPEDLIRYQADQLGLLDLAARLLAPGGVLVYATCSLEPEENEQVIAALLAAHHHLTATNSADLLPEAARSLVDAAGYFHPTPADGLDGFFAARLIDRRTSL
jgi:16S rRNA (cytosine967-C5)-methyltransferase